MGSMCKRCGYVASNKSNLLKHLRRVKPCDATLENIDVKMYVEELLTREYNAETYDCVICGKRFNTYQSRWRHSKTCKKQQTQFEESHSEIKALKDEIIELKTRLGCTNNTINITNNVNNIQNNIVLRSFGCESLEHLPLSFLNWCFANCKDGGGMVQLIKDIHFDDECPQNQNVRLKSSKRELMEVYSNGRWVVTDQNKVLTDLIEKGYRVLRSHGRKNKEDVMDDEDLEETDFREILEWLDKVYDDAKQQKPIKRELLLLILNKKPMLLGRDC